MAKTLRTRFLTFGFLAWSTSVILALPPANPNGGPAVVCHPDAAVIGTFHVAGMLLAGEQITIDASTAKIRAVSPDPLIVCALTLFPLDSFAWQIAAKPIGSAAQLVDAASLTPGLTTDVDGEYTVRFSACSDGCDVTLPSGDTLTAPPFTRDITFTAVDALALPPETEPLLPPLTPTASLPTDTFDGLCSFGSDLFSAAWVAVERWTGPAEYQLLEGEVIESRLAGKDNNLNHDSLDFLSFIDPDPPYRRLRTSSQDDVEVEWEYRAYPEVFRPTRSDRQSAVGYWIIDCPHGDKTEIHPPVLTAAHRPRAIRIPPAEGYGANVYVPGIATDLYIGQDAGETTRDCSATGLHQNAENAGIFGCLPQDPGGGIPGYPASPIDTVFRFYIYLPRDPRAIVSPIKPVPPVPLYRTVFARSGIDVGTGAPDPTVRVCPDECGGDPNDPTYLEVTVDLRGYTGAAYSRRIEAAWVYPSPDNWGMRTWKVQLNQIDVENDGDWEPLNDGDWLLWFNTNNKDVEWTKILDCNGCIEEGVYDFSGDPFGTGDVAPNRWLGPNLLLFPDQKIWIHTTGFEDDWLFEDPTGRVTSLHEQVARQYSVDTHYCDDCLAYTLDYEIIERAPFDDAGLTPAGEAIYNAYVITPADLSGAPSLLDREMRAWRHPAEEPSPAAPTPLDNQVFFKEQGHEPNTLHDTTLEEFQQLIATAQAQYPELLAETMTELRDEVDEAVSDERSDIDSGLSVLQESLPAEIWQAYFGDLGVVDNCPDHYNPAQLDDDGDGAGDDCDCAPQDPGVSPNFVEQNNGRDDNCNGLADEIEPRLRFAANGWQGHPLLDWPMQAGANLYQVLRSTRSDLTDACAQVTTPDYYWEDGEDPDPNEAFFYLARSVNPFVGSFGIDSSTTERVSACAGSDHVFTFRDRFQQDLVPFGLGQFFGTVSASTSDYISFEIDDDAGAPAGIPTAWCAERADWYVSEYLAHAQTGFNSLSGSWNKWSRDSQTGYDWIGPVQSGYPNRFGPACQGAHSWCTEDGLGGVPSRVVRPGYSSCELFYPPWGSCNGRLWRLTIHIGADRQRACGF